MKARIVKSEMSGRYQIVFTANHEFAGGKSIPKASDMAKIRIDVHDIIMSKATEIAKSMFRQQGSVATKAGKK